MVRRHGQVDVPPAMRKEICQCLQDQLTLAQTDSIRISPGTSLPVLFKRGGTGDPRIAAALHAFRAKNFTGQAWAQRAATLNQRQFASTAKRWLKRHVQTGLEGCSSCRVRKKTLTRAEKREIAVLLGTPGQLGKGSRYWRSIDEALEFHPQKKHLRQLVTKSKMQHRTLHDTLVTECKDLLKWGNLHRRDTLPDTTLKNRQRAAAQWRGDIPMWVASHRSVRAFGDDDVVGHPDHGEKHLFWDDPPGMAEFIYSKLTFMFDAYTTDNKEGAAAQPELGYISKTDAYAPEPAAAGMALSQTDSVCTYALVHPARGLIEDPMHTYWGSTPSNKKKDAKRRHDAAFPHWCANAPAQRDG